jgi:hypothetical protein
MLRRARASTTCTDAGGRIRYTSACARRSGAQLVVLLLLQCLPLPHQMQEGHHVAHPSAAARPAATAAEPALTRRSCPRRRPRVQHEARVRRCGGPCWRQQQEAGRKGGQQAGVHDASAAPLATQPPPALAACAETGAAAASSCGDLSPCG